MVPDWVTLHPDVTVVGSNGGVQLFLPGCAVVGLDGDEAARFVAMQEALLEPVAGPTVATALGEPLLPRLLERMILVGGDRATIDRLRPGPPPRFDRPLTRVVFGVCGTIAAAMVVPLVSCAAELLASEVDVVLTASARRFLRPRVLRYLGLRVFTDGYAPRPGAVVPHIHLAQGADAVIIAPASAATIARLASGACNDLLSLVVAATDAPVIVAPVMNAQMWRNPAIARNVAQVRSDGMHVVATDLGRCVASRSRVEGDRGDDRGREIGRMGLDPSNLVPVVRAIVGARRAQIAR